MVAPVPKQPQIAGGAEHASVVEPQPQSRVVVGASMHDEWITGGSSGPFPHDPVGTVLGPAHRGPKTSVPVCTLLCSCYQESRNR